MRSSWGAYIFWSQGGKRCGEKGGRERKRERRRGNTQSSPVLYLFNTVRNIVICRVPAASYAGAGAGAGAGGSRGVEGMEIEILRGGRINSLVCDSSILYPSGISFFRISEVYFIQASYFRFHFPILCRDIFPSASPLAPPPFLPVPPPPSPPLLNTHPFFHPSFFFYAF